MHEPMVRCLAAIAVVGLLAFTSSACGDSGDPQNNNENSNVNENRLACGNGTLDGAEQCDDGADNSDSQPDACRTSCERAHCGDGVTDTGEDCDDGPGNSDEVPDACRADCTEPGCGDGVVDVQAGESCDDGNEVAGDGCSATCRIEVCGNHVVDVSEGEKCDDGNYVGGDGCSADCRSLEICGNDYVDVATGEECDDGNQVDGDGCQADCRLPACGDGVEDSYEGCDLGVANSDEPDAACRLNCQPRRCGDDIVDVAAGEVCDDGNVVSGDGCSADCDSAETCGNGYVDVARGEECDDGNQVDGDGCQSTCLIPRCGDGVRDASQLEECDLGVANSDEPDALCRLNCRLRRCGDDIVDVAAGEVCDDGNVSSGDKCSGDCRSDETCGNGRVDAPAGEECDDGNLRSHDGCSSRCTAEALTWEPWTSALHGREHHKLVYDDARGVVVLFGGHRAWGLLDDTWEYDGSTWRQVRTPHHPPPRWRFGMAYDSQRQVTVVYGGDGESGVLGDTWEYDGVDWVEVFPIPNPGLRAQHGMAYDAARQEILMYGGRSSNGGELSDTYTYNGTWTQKSPSNVPGGIIGPALGYNSANQTVHMFGGQRSGDWYRWNFAWDGANWTWPPAYSAYRNRDASLAFDPTLSRMVMIYDDTWEHDGSTWTQVFPGTSPSSRTGHQLVYAPFASGVLLFGGATPEGLSADLWHYEGSTWTTRKTTSHTRIQSFCSAYDSWRDRLVIFGGDNLELTGYDTTDETWEFDGERWERMAPPVSPPGRTGHSCAFDSVRGVVVMTGTWDVGVTNDTWEWDGQQWTKGPVHPRGRYFGNRVVFDETAGVIWQFSGKTSNSVYVEGMYTYDGAWHLVTQPSIRPSIRSGFAAIYDPNQGGIVMHGGYDGSTSFDETWLWKNNAWTLLSPAHSPGASSGHDATYDERMGCTLAYGGALGQELWAYCQGDWKKLTPTFQPRYAAYYGLVYMPTQFASVLLGSLAGDEADTQLLRYVSSIPDEQCFSEDDEDGDGLVGCEDPDCQHSPCEDCDNGVDDDGDGDTDCLDSKCEARPCNNGTWVCSGGACVP